MIKAIMIILLGAGGNSQALSVTKFETLAECESAKQATVQSFADEWNGPGARNIRCVPYANTDQN